MNELQIIKQEVILGMQLNIFGNIEEPLFLAKEIAEHIEHSDVSKMCINLEEGTEKLIRTLFVAGQNREVTLLTEDGVYEVLMTSRKPKAKELKKGLKEFLKSWRRGEVKVVSKRDSLLIDLFSNDPNVVTNAHKELLALETKPLERKIKLQAQEIESKTEALEYQEDVIVSQESDLKHKQGVILDLMEGVELASKRQRINQVVRHNTIVGDYQASWTYLYSEFEMKYHMNLDRQMNSKETKAIKPKIKSKMDYIDRVLGMIPELYDVAIMAFETDMIEVIRREKRNKLK